MANYEIVGDVLEELNKILYEQFVEEANWAFAETFELLPLWSENSHQ